MSWKEAFARWKRTNSGIYNLGYGQARSFNELIDVLNRSLGTNFEADYIDNPHAHYQNFTQADLNNARAALGYEPQFSLERGVADYMKWLYPVDPCHPERSEGPHETPRGLRPRTLSERSRDSSLRSE